MSEGRIITRALPFVPIKATGGTIDDVLIDGVLYRIHTFTAVGSHEFLVSQGSTQIDCLIVAGGGGGGAHHGGGGGAGGLVFIPNKPIAVGAHEIIVGAGGLGRIASGATNTANTGNPGSPSSALGITALGGGAGITHNVASSALANGGSGGGGQNWTTASTGGTALQPSQPGESGTYGYGNAGSTTTTAEDFRGGGGGAGGPPGSGHRETNGGAGLDLSAYFGTSVGDDGWFAGGGGAGIYRNPGTDPALTGFGNNGAGLKGGGGRGGVTLTGVHGTTNEGSPVGSVGTIRPEISALPNTGGGGGGTVSYTDGIASGSGGSGIVIIRYPLQRSRYG